MKKDCRVAARIANDILDKDPAYYNQSVRGAKDIAKCRWYVSNETNLRSRRRAAAAANKKSGTKAGGGSSATAAPRKRKSAPRPAKEQTADDFAE